MRPAPNVGPLRARGRVGRFGYDPAECAELALGMAGIYFLAENIPASVLSLVTLLHEREHVVFLTWIGSVQIVLMLLFGGALFGFRGPLAARLSRDMDAAPSSTPAPGVQGAAISVLGLYFFVPAVSSLIANAALAVEEPRFANTEFVRPAVQTVLGAALFLGARGLVRVWTLLRVAGRHRELAESGTRR